VNSSVEADIVYVPFFPQFGWPCFCGERYANLAADFASGLAQLLPDAATKPHFLVNHHTDLLHIALTCHCLWLQIRMRHTYLKPNCR